MTDVLSIIAAAIGNLDSVDNAKAFVTNAVSQGLPAADIVERGIRGGLEIVGQKYEAGEYFLSELLYAGSLVSDLLGILKPLMKNQQLERKGVIVLGTVRGDIHDIGKNIFKMLVDSAGFEVHDLGVDVEPASFVEEVRGSDPQVLGLSALLTTALAEMKSTMDTLGASGVGSSVKVLLGGNAIQKAFAKEIGADAAALDAVEGLEICRKWTQK
jgi:methanogenic corrinoid protein MtbC1